ncbi:hypothetical protein J5N97_000559 [Dioscorea zingiberensis]|uniref:Histidine-containing phosphotransfer protein n=1 Tax=Dioscorea zingiberensis TaxID=325984 RepID=A0A9D5H2X7_9LILI|nr:hypothetical protein J5N97_000559 [Dioscorea zingiberensis]
MLGLGACNLEVDMNRLIELLFHQGVLDEQFMQLQHLQDESSPNFVYEVVTLYFRESEKLLRNLRALLYECTDYKKMGIHLNQMMGSSSSIVVKHVQNISVRLYFRPQSSNWIGCIQSLEVLEHEYFYLKNKLHEFLQIEQQRVIAAGVRYHPLLQQ